MIKKFLFILCLIVSLEAKEANRYSVITIQNGTPFRIFYSYRWGEGERTWRNSIKPNGYYVHWWKFDYPNEDHAPWFYLNRDGDGHDQWYRLGSFYSPDKKSKSGRLYRFKSEGEGNTHEIKLYERLYMD